ncbi:MAG TPA: F0F1 ATP synthase subunit delta [Alphaproteobacteria bacterium]|nr:F0F1 ATP synthase subunit delta [Alphaproteobacteria bacterium]
MASEATGLGGIAERYATALYELAEADKQLDTVAGDLGGIKAMIGQSADLRRLIRSPLIDRDKQSGAVAAVLARAGVSDLTRRFVGVVTANRRLFALPQILDGFLALLAARRGEVTAHVTSANALEARHVDALTETLRRIVGGKVTVDLKVDPNILGGLVVRVGSRMFDSSLRTKLQRMQLAMKGIG